MNSEQPQNTSLASLATSAKGAWEPLRLTYLKPSLTYKEVMLIARPDLWHKFIIFGVESYEKSTILDAIISACNPEVLLPVMFTIENPQKATFLAKCSVSTIDILVGQGLRVQLPDGCTLALDIVVGYVDKNEFQINPQREINRALHSRYEPSKKLLQLDDFKNDKAFHYVYCSIIFPKVLHLIIRCCNIRIIGSSRDYKLMIRELSLRSNGLTTIFPIEKYFHHQLTKVDLSNNDIPHINNLRAFREFPITDLWLDGNPLCSSYQTIEDYVNDVKNVFPQLLRLDGVPIGIEAKSMPLMKTMYLGKGSRTMLVKQFTRHFFTLYDQIDRNVMNGLYDQDALFSITLGSITNTTHHQMTKAFANNRNLLKFVDYAKCHEFLLRGPEKIIAALRRQPPTYHNYQKFCIDILHATEDCITIAIQGSFCYQEYPHAPLLFNRTFVIAEAFDNEYCIVNDQYHIQSESTKIPPNEAKPGPIIVPKFEPTIFSPTEKQQLLTFFRGRTTMNENASRRYLDDANWDIRAALNAFVKDYSGQVVPSEAFA